MKIYQSTPDTLVIEKSGNDNVVIKVDGNAIGTDSAAKVAAIATPASASATDCANKINDILTALTAAGLMKNA